jgi:outer membrane protein
MTRSLRLLLLVASLSAGQTTAAADLIQVYRDARAFDAQYAAARYALEAGREKLPQGRALVLPTLSLSGNVTNSRIDSSPLDSLVGAPFIRDARSYGATLSFSQPIYRQQNWIQYDQAEIQVRQAEAVFGQAEQDLIVRVTQGYVDVLSAKDTLELVRAQKIAIAEQLAQAKRNFEVGTATITDTHEAQARFDLSSAQEISAQNDLENKARALRQLAGKNYDRISPLRPDIRLRPPNPNDIQAWVEFAEKQGYPVQIQEAATEIARLEARRNSAAHHPTLDLVASYGYASQTASQISAAGSNFTTGIFGLQVAVPLYAGGALNAREREAAANFEKSKQDLDNARRSNGLTSQQTFLGVINGIAQIGALEQALVSSQSALESNKLGYEVGVRINIDVLNAQQQLFSTRRDLALARYNTIINHLRLKASAGSLKEEDLEEMNRALAP